jgi:MYXO-CTERM domain-containing protein
MPNLRSLIVFSGLAILALLLTTRRAEASNDLPDAIPNGDVNRCENCHIGGNPNGGLNAFGDDFAQAGETWKPSLATMDSDGDTFTNGWELQDPTGSWTTGQGAPGVASVVTLPGVALSIPPQILLDVMLIDWEEEEGTNGSSFFTVANSGGLTLDYSASETEAWMSLDPVAGQVVAGSPAEQVDVLFQTTGLAEGLYQGMITVNAAGISNSPQQIAVDLTVVPEPSSTTLGLATLSTLVLLARHRRRRTAGATRPALPSGHAAWA